MVDSWLPVSINNQTISPGILKKLFEDGEMRYELCHGELKALPASSISHGLLLAWIGRLLIERTIALPDWWVLADPHSKIRDDHWRRPDLAVIRASDAEPWKYVMPGHWPALCIEIVSTPDQTVDDMLEKSKIYHEQGVDHCWVLDPESHTAWTFDRGKEPIWIPNKNGILEASTIGIRLSLNEIWRGLKGKRSKKLM